MKLRMFLIIEINDLQIDNLPNHNKDENFVMQLKKTINAYSSY